MDNEKSSAQQVLKGQSPVSWAAVLLDYLDLKGRLLALESKEAVPGSQAKQFGSQTVFGRAAQPVELAPIYVFLASNHASYVSGEVYGATGGQTPI